MISTSTSSFGLVDERRQAGAEFAQHRPLADPGAEDDPDVLPHLVLALAHRHAAAGADPEGEGAPAQAVECPAHESRTGLGLSEPVWPPASVTRTPLTSPARR